MAAPPVTERHKPHFHRRAPMLESVRVATTGSVTIAAALNVGDVVDGVTLAAGNRVLVWAQSTASQNGIYIVGATPERAYDLSTADPNFGFLVYVREGTANGGKTFANTNTAEPTIGSTTISFEELDSGVADHGALTGLTDDDHPQYLATTQGGGAEIVPHGSMGSTETVDPAGGNVHTGTLNADCVVTLASPTRGGACELELEVAQDGTGGWALTFAGTVTVVGTLITTASTTQILVVRTIDAGATWTVHVVGSDGAVVAALDDLTDVTVAAPAEDDTLRYIGGEWVNDNRRWEPVTTNPGGGPELVWDGDDIVMTWRNY